MKKLEKMSLGNVKKLARNEMKQIMAGTSNYPNYVACITYCLSPGFRCYVSSWGTWLCSHP